MATKNCLLSFKEKEKAFVNINSSAGGDKYCSLNLNQNYEYPILIPAHSYSKTIKNEYSGGK